MLNAIRITLILLLPVGMLWGQGGTYSPGDQNYQGRRFCNQPMPGWEFDRIRDEVRRLPGDAERFERIRTNLSNQCYSTAQIYQLMILFRSARYEYDLVRLVYYYCYDLDNYGDLLIYMQDPALRNEMEVYLSGRPAPGGMVSRDSGTPQVVDDAELEQVFGTLDRISDEAVQLIVVRQLLRTNNLTANQFARILQRFMLSQNRLELAKDGYDHIFDPANYHVLFRYLSSPDVRRVQEHMQSHYRGQEQQLTHPRIPGCERLMSRNDFQSELRMLRNRTRRRDRMRIAKSIVNRQCIDVQQLLLILEELGSENDQLEFAQYAYSRIQNPWNYYQVYGNLKRRDVATLLDAYLSNR